MKNKITIAISGLLLASAMGYATADTATAPTATPAPSQQDLFSVLSGTKISLDDAIKTAEQTVSGKLLKAELSDDSNPNTYRVAIADNNSRTVTFMKIDSSTGKVIGSKVYRPDNRTAKNKAGTAAKAPAAMDSTKPTAPAAATSAKPAAPVAPLKSVPTPVTPTKP